MLWRRLLTTRFILETFKQKVFNCRIDIVIMNPSTCSLKKFNSLATLPGDSIPRYRFMHPCNYNSKRQKSMINKDESKLNSKTEELSKQLIDVTKNTNLMLLIRKTKLLIRLHLPSDEMRSAFLFAGLTTKTGWSWPQSASSSYLACIWRIQSS